MYVGDGVYRLAIMIHGSSQRVSVSAGTINDAHFVYLTPDQADAVAAHLVELAAILRQDPGARP